MYDLYGTAASPTETRARTRCSQYPGMRFRAVMSTAYARRVPEPWSCDPVGLTDRHR